MLLRAERGTGAWDEVLRLADAARQARRDLAGGRRRVQGAGDGRAARALGGRRRRLRAPLARHPLARAGAAAPCRRGRASRHHARPRRPGARDHREGPRRGVGRRSSSRSTASCRRRWMPRARTAEASARIERAERWLLERERDPGLLAALGRLCAQAELWGKAKSFLEASLSFEPTAHRAPRAGAAFRTPRRERGRAAPLPARRRAQLKRNQGQTTFSVNDHNVWSLSRHASSCPHRGGWSPRAHRAAG